MLLLVVALCLFVGLALTLYTVFDHFERQSTVRASLRQLGGFELDNTRELDLLEPVSDRVLAPVRGAFVKLGRRFTPQGYSDRCRQKLIISGKPGSDELDRFLAVRVVTLVAIPVVFYLWYFVMPLSGKTQTLTFGLVTLALVMGPDAILNRDVAARQEAIRRALPDILDLLTISVEAGLGFEQALDRTVSNVPGPLSDEFIRMLNETRAGSSRAEAMRAVEQRVDVMEVRTFVLAILQADTFGVSIGRILRAQADEMRIKRRQIAQEKALKAPVKMLLPMVFCIFPSLFVVVMGPAVINILHNLH